MQNQSNANAVHPASVCHGVGNYLDMSVGEMLLKKYLHPECMNCTRPKDLSLSAGQIGAMSRLLF